jgi:hypothetical protein
MTSVHLSEYLNPGIQDDIDEDEELEDEEEEKEMEMLI